MTNSDPGESSQFAIVSSPTMFLSDPGNPGVRSMGPGVSHSLSPRGFADLTDVTLADDDTNSILTDNANRAIQGNVATILTLPC